MTHLSPDDALLSANRDLLLPFTTPAFGEKAPAVSGIMR
jgi:hypothetical protein